MSFMRDISVYRKLVFIQMVTALCVVLLVTGTFVYVYYKEVKESKIENLHSLGLIVSTSSASSLVFNDEQSAQEILRDLESKEDILEAEIRDIKGHTFASFTRKGKFTPLRGLNLKLPRSHHYFDDYVLVAQHIRFDGETIGYLILKASTNDLNAYLIKRINIAGIVALIGILLAYVLANTLQRYISKPIYKLLNVMNEVKNTANYDVRATAVGKDEIGMLSSVFNEMLNVMEKKDQEVLSHNTSLKEKVRERTKELEANNEQLRQKNEEIVVAKIQAEQSKAVKELFLANMSHEIRTPLNAIIGFQQLLKQTELDETQHEYVAAIDFAGKNLLTLVNDILDLSKIESGKLQFEDTEFELKAQITKVLELLQKRADEKGLQLKLHHDDRIPDHVIGDSTRFNQILLNLLSNSVKFTDKGKVDITTQLIRMDEYEIWCGFEVKDTGIGIPDRQLNKIFDSFTQAGIDTARIYGGTGLGLTICKHLVERFGGTIKVYSKVGVGSMFSFDIHFKRPEKNREHKEETLEVEEGSMNRTLRILLAEDVMINQRLMQKMAENWGYEIQVCANGRIAVEALKKENYDVVLMDIQMPEMNGFEATRAIRDMEDQNKKNIPIIALTAHASNAEAEKCLALGMNAYLTKPFEKQHLYATMNKLVNSREKQWISQQTAQSIKPDFISLNTIRQHAQGDKDYIHEMVQMYIDNMPQYILELEDHLQSEDLDQIYGVVHMMKSPIALFEAREILEIISRIETDYKQNNTGSAWLSEVQAVKALVNKSVELMKKELKIIENEGIN